MEVHFMHNNGRINIPNAPLIPGLVFRKFQGDQDFPKMANVINACMKADKVDDKVTAETITSDYRHLVNSDPYRDMVFVEIRGQTVGYSRTGWRNEPDGTYIYEHTGYLLPEYRRRGIGSSILHYNQDHLLKIAATQPNATSRFFEAVVVDTAVEANAILVDDGYNAARYFYHMVRPSLENIPNCDLPEGIEVRPVQLEHLPIINEASREAFRDHWGFSEDREPTVQQWMDSPYFDPGLWRVAWDGDQVVGMVLSYINRDENAEYNRKRGWTEDICVRKPWRNRGIARALIAQSFEAIKSCGMQEAALGVDTQNLTGALNLYISLGFEPVRRFTVYRKWIDQPASEQVSMDQIQSQTRR